uniref:Secreted protein n=1 Tax=Knipowitschia caucasica TaxID=637954 RepID=A0AAV2JDS9_KNICA
MSHAEDGWGCCGLVHLFGRGVMVVVLVEAAASASAAAAAAQSGPLGTMMLMPRPPLPPLSSAARAHAPTGKHQSVDIQAKNKD